LFQESEDVVMVSSSPTEFAGSTQNPKKLSEHQINQSKRKFSQKKLCLVSQKCKGAKNNSYEGYPTEFAGSTQNYKKNNRKSNQPIRTEIFPKKVCLVPQKCKGSENFLWGLPDGIRPGSLKNNTFRKP
jgi:hypothetical protein